MFLPGFFNLPPVDRDESRFAQASRQMLESVALPEAQRDPVLHGGGLVLPRVQGRDRLTKPPLIYWLQAGAAAVLTGGEPLRDAIWMYRVPSLLAGIIAVLATWRLGVSMFGSAAGFLAGVLIAVCPVVVWEAHQARADMVLLACTTVAMLGLWKVYSGTPPLRGGSSAETHRSRSGLWWALVFWLALSAGAMTKGPITPMVALLTVLAVCIGRREWRWVPALRPVPGMLILAATVGPWVWAVASRVGWEHYWSAIYDETIGRSLATKEGHWGPPGYHTVLMPVLFWPGSMLTGLSLVTAWKRVRQSRALQSRVLQSRDREGATTVGPDESHSLTLGARSGTGLVFLLAWLVPSWIAFELVTTKLPHYTLPLYPALALVSAWGLREVVLARLTPSGAAVIVGVRAWAGLTAILPAALVLLPLLLYQHPVRFHVAWVVVLLAAVFGAAALGLRVPRHPDGWLRLQRRGVAVALAVAVLGVGLLPYLPNLWITRQIGAVLRRAQADGPVASLGYREDSLVFLTRGRVEWVSPEQAIGWLPRHPGGVIVVPDNFGLLADRVGVAQGFNYSRGRFERYEIQRATP